mgnify:CR=1 FL=1
MFQIFQMMICDILSMFDILKQFNNIKNISVKQSQGDVYDVSVSRAKAILEKWSFFSIYA